MAQVRSWAGLDVHARSVLAVTTDAETGELRSQRLPGDTAKVVEFCCSLPGPTRVAYEAGPTGYGLARALEAVGVGCVVAAPGKIERPSGDRVKTDERDAGRLLRLLMIDGLHPVRVPAVEEEALRDLVRARDDVRGDLMRARQRLSKLLLRHDVLYEDTGSAWTKRHRAWLRAQDIGGGAQITLLDHLGAIDVLESRREQLETVITELIPASPYALGVARLRCLRGIDTLSAVGLAVEIGDFARFKRPAQLMSYVGLVPSENSTGASRRRERSRRPDRGTPADCSSKRPGTTARHPAEAPCFNADRPVSPRQSLSSRGRRNAGSTASGNTSTPSAESAARLRRRPRTRRVLLGDHDRRLTSQSTTSVAEAAGAWRSRESIRDLAMNNRHRTRSRSILDSRALTTKTGPADTGANPCTRA